MQEKLSPGFFCRHACAFLHAFLMTYSRVHTPAAAAVAEPPLPHTAAGNLRKPFAHARKISLGLLSPSDLAGSGSAFFSDVVALLSEAEAAPAAAAAEGERCSDGSSAGLLLNLCALLAKVGDIHRFVVLSLFEKRVLFFWRAGPSKSIREMRHKEGGTGVLLHSFTRGSAIRR